ncbi:N-6 DNA methylase [Enterobacter hormaechei]|uniref:N-6 DNA methylase n=1 Tax=Enterobacter hormaechei TaxID=158836 RepID=UPI003CC61518
MSAKRVEGDDLRGDTNEYFMRLFAPESGNSRWQFYTSEEMSRILANVALVSVKDSSGCYCL